MMEKKAYVGFKLLNNAEKMSKSDYCIRVGRPLGEGEDMHEKGYLVEYEDGYRSWSPAEVFNEAYRSIHKGMDFSMALYCAKRGWAIARAGWNGKDQFVYHVPSQHVATKTDVAVKAFGPEVYIGDYLSIKTSENTVNTWVPSVSDLFANDWFVID